MVPKQCGVGIWFENWYQKSGTTLWYLIQVPDSGTLWSPWPSSTVRTSLKGIFSELRSWLYTAQRTQWANFCSHYLLLTHEIIRVCLKEYFNPKKAKGAYEFTWLKHIRRGPIDGVNSGATHANGNIISIILLNICLFKRRFCIFKRMSYVYWLWKGLKPKKLIHLHVMIFWQ